MGKRLCCCLLLKFDCYLLEMNLWERTERVNLNIPKDLADGGTASKENVY
jgi:hypothetical protein